jgi:BolA protein
MLKRHQLVYGLLDEELKSGVHALTMSTKTPEEATAK